MKLYFHILFHYGGAFKRNLLVAYLSLGVYNLMGAVSLALVIPFLEILFSDQSYVAPASLSSDWLSVSALKARAFGWLGAAMQTEGKMTVLVWFCGFIGGAIIIKNIFRYLSVYSLAPVEQGVMRNLRNRIFEHLTRLSPAFYARTRKGRILNIAVNDAQIVQEAVVGTLNSLFSDPLTMLVFLIAMLVISWKLTLFTLLVLPLTGLIISRIAKSLKKRAVRGQAEFDRLLALLDEFTGGVRIVKAFTAETIEQRRYAQINEDYTEIMTGFRRRTDLASPLTEVLSIFVVIGVILYGGSLILSGAGELKASEFIGFIALFSQFLAPIKTLSNAVSRVQKALVSYRRIQDLLEEPIPPTEQNVGKPVATFNDRIAFQNVGFRYEDGHKDALKNASFEVKKGQTVALVGASGGGKSTLADLTCRFFDPTAGKILIDGQDFRDLNPYDLRRLMGIVTQEGILFNDSILNNIAYGDETSASDDRLTRARQAARIANALEFIDQLPEGFDATIGERGAKLSGGQRQRIAIARAVYKNPPILVLDEATSALDNQSEKLVQSALEELMKNRTTLVVAHRLSTIEKADCILLVDEGEIAERGTHAELMALGGRYRALYEGRNA